MNFSLEYETCQEKSPGLKIGARGKAGGEGFEPPHTDPESAVLPLDEPPKPTKHILPPAVEIVQFMK